MAGHIIRGPGEHDGGGGVDAHCREDGAEVGYAGFVGGRGEEEDVAEDGDAGGGDYEGGANVGAFRKDGHCDGEEGGAGVGGDGEELGLGGGVAEFFYYGGLLGGGGVCERGP